MVIQGIDMDKILDAMEAAAEEIYNNSRENYPATKGRHGQMAVSIRSCHKPDQWQTLERTFGESCYREPKNLNGRQVDQGANYAGIMWGKIVFSRRTGHNSGASSVKVKEGESFWKGNIYKDSDRMATFSFSGFSELDDVKVAQAGRQELKRQMLGN
jgi:hypothetical protein